jgi:hypothetical protein
MVSMMGQKRGEQRYRPRPPNPSPPPPNPSQQRASEMLGLPNLSPTSQQLVIKRKAPRRFRGKPYEGTFENYMDEMQKAYSEKTKARIGQLEKKASKLAQRRYLLQEEDRLRRRLNAMSPNSPSPPRGSVNRGSMNHKKKIRSYNNNPEYTKKMLELRARANPSPPRSPRRARYYNKLKQLYTTGRAKKVAKKARAERIEKRRGKRKRPRQVQKPRKKKKPTLAPAARMKAFNKKMTSKLPKIRTTNPTIAQIQRNLLKKKYALTDLVTGKIKTFTKKGWYDRAVAKQQILRMRICT